MTAGTPVEYTWDAEDEIQLFFALDGLRPFGKNKHFNMAILVERLMNKLGKDINSSILWAKLKTMYNLSALDDIEPNPIDLEEESDFALPESYLHNKLISVDSTDDVEDESESKSEKSETPSSVPASVTPATGTNNTLQVVKETEGSRTRNSTPARDASGNNASNDSHSNNTSSSGTTKRTQPKRTRASTSTNDTPSSSPSTPTPTTTKRRRI